MIPALQGIQDGFQFPKTQDDQRNTKEQNHNEDEFIHVEVIIHINGFRKPGGLWEPLVILFEMGVAPAVG
jgi:hypothetical protein